MSESVIIYLSVALGVTVSVILPVIRPLLPQPKKVEGLSRSEQRGKTWKVIQPYVLTGVFSLIVALILVAYMGEIIEDWRGGFLAGYTADSTLQKISTSSKNE